MMIASGSVLTMIIRSEFSSSGLNYTEATSDT